MALIKYPQLFFDSPPSSADSATGGRARPLAPLWEREEFNDGKLVFPSVSSNVKFLLGSTQPTFSLVTQSLNHLVTKSPPHCPKKRGQLALLYFLN